MLHHPLQAVIPLYSRIITILLGTATSRTTRVEQSQLDEDRQPTKSCGYEETIWTRTKPGRALEENGMA